MATILMIGTRSAALEGISQTLSALGHNTRVAGSVHDARELATMSRPLVIVSERELAEHEGAAMLGIPLAAGGAILLFRTGLSAQSSLSPALQRVVLADLALPLERNRLVALIQHVEERAQITRGREHDKRSGELSL